MLEIIKVIILACQIQHSNDSVAAIGYNQTTCQKDISACMVKKNKIKAAYSVNLMKCMAERKD